jgi:K+-sensing histidine kinase KdpD
VLEAQQELVEDLSLHILDVVENSLRAGAQRVEVLVVEDMERDSLILQIADTGKGMTREECARAADPFFTTKPGRRVGLGLPLLAQAAREAEGTFDLSSAPGAGTVVRASFRLSHRDRKPLGDIAASLETLIAGHPEVQFIYEHRRGQDAVRLDSRSLSDPDCDPDSDTDSEKARART